MKLFKKKEKSINDFSKFREHIQKGIELLLNSKNQLTDEMVLDLLQKNGISRNESIEILLFLPIAFLRKLYDHLKWHDTYLELDDNHNHVEKKFADSIPYQIIYQETEKYFRNLPVSKDILKIGGRSAEFKALNDLLLQNPDTKPEEIVLSKTAIVR